MAPGLREHHRGCRPHPGGPARPPPRPRLHAEVDLAVSPLARAARRTPRRKENSNASTLYCSRRVQPTLRGAPRVTAGSLLVALSCCGGGRTRPDTDGGCCVPWQCWTWARTAKRCRRQRRRRPARREPPVECHIAGAPPAVGCTPMCAHRPRVCARRATTGRRRCDRSRGAWARQRARDRRWPCRSREGRRVASSRRWTKSPLDTDVRRTEAKQPPGVVERTHVALATSARASTGAFETTPRRRGVRTR